MGKLRRIGRPGFSILEFQVALVLFGLALSGLYPLVVMRSRQLKKFEERLSPQTTYYLVPSPDLWAQKLGAAATMQTQDPGPLPPPPVTVIDNGEPGYSESGTGWNDDTQPNAHQGNLSWHAAGIGANSATWEFTGIPVGWYDIRVTWLEGGDRATNATFQVFDGTTLKGTYSVNQMLAPSGSTYNGRPWLSLAVLSFTSGSPNVVLTDNANGRVIADGLRIVSIQNDVQVMSVERSLTSEEMTVHASVTILVPQ
jgi:hypothetical protein